MEDELDEQNESNGFSGWGKIALAVLLIAIIGGAALYLSNPTMFASLPFVSGNPAGNSSGDAVNLFGSQDSSDDSSDNNSIVFKEINLSTDMNSGEYVFSISNADLAVDGSFLVEETGKEKLAFSQGTFLFKNFSGQISQKSSKIVLLGNLSSIVGENVSVNYLENKALVVEIGKTLSVGNVLVESFDSGIFGKLTVPGISMNFDSANIELKKFNGKIELTGQNIKFDGKVEQLKATTQIANVKID